MRTPYKEYPEYHTSFDNESVISFSAMERTVDVYFDIVNAFELNDVYINTCPYGEPQLGKRGLYADINAQGMSNELEKRMHLLSYADGNHDLIDIAEMMDVSIFEFRSNVELLLQSGLLIRK
jgi:aminopeptidase-like protein